MFFFLNVLLWIVFATIGNQKVLIPDSSSGSIKLLVSVYERKGCGAPHTVHVKEGSWNDLVQQVSWAKDTVST